MTTALVIGAGPAGLMAADVLSASGLSVTLADQMPSPARKFLMAGKSGLNLTKDEDAGIFLARFGNVSSAFAQAVSEFGPEAVQAWARDLGQEVFTGSTGRVFPRAMKASPLLRAWLARLEAQRVTLHRRWRWDGFEDGTARFSTPEGPQALQAQVVVLALGGASWRRLGSDGAWATEFRDVAPFKPANCGLGVAWSDHMRPFFGTPVKATALMAGEVMSRGEWVITERGIEGGGVYEVSAAVRDGASLRVDLLPDVPSQVLEERIRGKRAKQSQSQFMKKSLKLSPVKAALFQEFARRSAGASFKDLNVEHTGPLPMDEAISTAGGLRLDALDGWMLRDRPGMFAAGEMLDWEAPTGGYLISGCLASGRAAARQALDWVHHKAG